MMTNMGSKDGLLAKPSLTLTPGLNATPGLVVLFCLLWSSAFVAGKIGVGVCPPLLLLAVRFLLAGLLLLAFCAATGRLRRRPKRGRRLRLPLSIRTVPITCAPSE